MAKKLFDIEIGEFDASFGTGANPEWSFAYIILGEFGGWDGVRKECKRLYRDAGVMM